VYEASALDHPGKGQARVIDNDIAEHARGKRNMKSNGKNASGIAPDILRIPV
jgi:hypothetical protein